MRSPSTWLAALIAVTVVGSLPANQDELSADLILFNTQIWTADENHPKAEALAVEGRKIAAVGTNEEVLSLQGASTDLIDLEGRLVVPGFIDGHTHFENATEWFFEARLMDVDSQSGMLERLAEAVQRVPKGLWITGGDWGEVAARKARKVRKRGDKNYLSFVPSLAAIDAVSPDHPVLFRRHDGNYFANSKALEVLRINKFTPNPDGGWYEHDPASGELTGMLMRSAGDRARLALPPKSKARTKIASKALMIELNRNGITGIHDVARMDEISQQQIYHTHVERSYSDIGIFTDLREENALTVRIYALLPLAAWDWLSSHGIRPGSGDELIRFGALKSFIDGSMMFEPFNNNPNYSGDFTFRVQSPELSHRNFLAADRLGFDMATHQIGDKAIALYLDWLEEATRVNGPRDRRPRLIHMEYPHPGDIRRAGALRAFADITPAHMLKDLDKIEQKIGPERAQSAFPGRTLIDNGVRINLVSDWPGDFYKINAKPINPLINIFMAVVRRYPGEAPEKSWHPEEGITIEEGLRAYTINPAYASHEENIKGSISPGKLADLVVLSRNILNGPAEDLLTTEVVYTVLNGDVVYQKAP